MPTIQELYENDKKLPRTALMSVPGCIEGVSFAVRIVRPGECYGLGLGKVNNKSKTLVEFYDERYMHTPIGQFVARYYLDTMLERGEGGLSLDTGEPSWSIPAASMAQVRAELSRLAA